MSRGRAVVRRVVLLVASTTFRTMALSRGGWLQGGNTHMSRSVSG
jgi:hypothetical protein